MLSADERQFSAGSRWFPKKDYAATMPAVTTMFLITKR